jgi:SAM-dependent methyltransferase
MVPYKSGIHEVPEGGLGGVCPVCGEHSQFSRFTANERESGECSCCSAINRQRQLGTVIRRVFGLNETGVLRFEGNCDVYNTESKGALHNALSKSASYTCSEYFGGALAVGSTVGGIRNEDIQSLTFSDQIFDLVVSSEVLEHMPRPYDAHQEIFRVLRSGGHHIFTVPFYPWEALDQVRAVEESGEIVYLQEAMYHEDPIKPEDGILVWNIFGLQMIVELERIGFKVSYWNLHDLSKGIIGPWSIVFDARKP